MIDIRFLRENPEAVKENIRKKFQDAKLPLVDEVVDLDAKRRAAIAEVESLKAARNKLSKANGPLYGQLKKCDDEAKKAELQAQIAQLKEQVRRLELEKDILEGTVEILKKGQGADPASLTNKEKADLIGALRPRYMLKDLLNALQMPRSSCQALYSLPV